MDRKNPTPRRTLVERLQDAALEDRVVRVVIIIIIAAIVGGMWALWR